MVVDICVDKFSVVIGEEVVGWFVVVLIDSEESGKLETLLIIM